MAVSFTAFEEYVAQMMKEHHIVGAAVAVAQGGQVIYRNGFGLKDLETKEPVNPDTIFGLASVSKSFAAMATMQLMDRGLLSRDDAVIKYVPEFKIRGVLDMNTVRIHHLLSHSTGLPPLKRKQGIKPLPETIKNIAEQEYEPLGKPGDFFSYSNDTFIVLGAVVEAITGKPYAQYVQENILDPIGMARTTYGCDDLVRWGNLTSLYVRDGKTGEYQKQEWPELGNNHVSGGLRSSVNDMIKYLQVYTSDGMAGGRRILSDYAVRLMRQPVILTGRNNFYAYGLQVSPGYGDVTVVEHGGSLPGVSANIGFVPERGIAAVALTNVSEVPAASIRQAALNTVLGLPVDRQVSVEPAWNAPPGYVAKFAGTYKSLEGGDVKVIVEGDSVQVENNMGVFSVRASDECHLVYAGPRGETVIRFFFDNQGDIWAALAGSRMFRKTS